MKEAITNIFKDFIILKSGEKIYPEEIEEFYKKVAPIKEMCTGLTWNRRILRKLQRL